MKNLQIGIAKRELTPPKGTELCGYGYYLERKNTAISDPLYVRSVAFRQEDRRYLLVNCDLEGVDGVNYAIIKAEISRKLNLSENDMLLATIHSHTAPAFTNLTGCGEPNPEYIKEASNIIIECACEAFASMREVVSAKVSSANVTDFGYDRTNSGIRINKTFHALTFEFAEGRPLVLLNYGCHPVSYGISDKVSADYPGAAVREMDALGYDALFLVGFCGDVDPTERHTYDCVEKGRQFASVYRQSLASAKELDDLTIKSASFDEYVRLRILSEDEIKKYSESFLKAVNYKDSYQKVAKLWAATNMKRTEGTLPAVDLLHVRFFSIGKVLLAGFSAEMTSELSYIISDNMFPDHIVFTMGNLFDTRRYIAAAALVDKEGYEGFTSTFAYNTTPIVKGEGERLVLSACNTAKQIMGL